MYCLKKRGAFKRVKHSLDLLKKLQRELLEPLEREYPETRFGFDLERTAGIGYYTDFCFHVFGKNESHLRLQLADGGLTDWTRKLLQSKKEMLLATGFGADLVQKMFHLDPYKPIAP